MTNEILVQNGAANACHVSRGDAQNENNDIVRAMVDKIARLPQPMHQAIASYCKPLQIDASTFQKNNFLISYEHVRTNAFGKTPGERHVRSLRGQMGLNPPSDHAAPEINPNQPSDEKTNQKQTETNQKTRQSVSISDNQRLKNPFPMFAPVKVHWRQFG